MFNNQILAGSSGQGGSFYDYSINQSLRFEESGTANLTRTPSSAATDNKKFTFSVWIKRGQDSSDNQHIVQSKNTGSGTGQGQVGLYIDTSDKINFSSENGGNNGSGTRLLRDHSAWYHICFVYNTTEATAADRIKIYINGEQETLTGNFPALNSVMSSMNYNGQEQYIGKYVSGFTRYFNGYMAEMHMVDGTALDADSFGETSNGVWVPKAYSGSYGTNGFYLSFADSAAIGDDLSGNTNDFTANSLAASDVVPDSPTNSFCTLNPLTHGTYPTLSEGNLKIATVYSADLCGVTSTWFPTTGKWYWEIHSEGSTLTYPYFGITDQRQVLTNSTKGSFYSVAWGRAGTAVAQTVANTYMGTITKENATSWTNDDIIMFALDVDARKLWIGKNGTWNDSGDPAAGTGENASWTEDTGVSPSFMGYNGQGVNSVFNFGQDGTFNGNQTAQGNADDNGVGDFYYSPPTSFLAMATSNIEEPAIGPNSTTTSDEHFDTILYTAATSNGTYTHGDLAFRPDFSWIKNRNNSERHLLTDVVRGNTSVTDKFLVSNSTDAEGANGVSGTTFSVTDTGYEFIETSIGTGELYFNGRTYVGWNWKAGGTAVSNTDGSITSSVSANSDSGCSIVKYTGTGANATVGHGLSSAPEMVIVKNTTTGSRDWAVGHDGLGGWGNYIQLNLTNGITSAAAIWNSTAPTSSVFSIGTNVQMNTSGNIHIAYCFHSVEGFSKAGTYLGNSSSNGTFVYTGFRPAWVIIKSKSSGTDWAIYDSKRVGYNPDNNLQRNVAAAEQTDDDVDFLSNGFKLRRSSTNFNNSSHTYFYLAFAEAPFKYANAR